MNEEDINMSNDKATEQSDPDSTELRTLRAGAHEASLAKVQAADARREQAALASLVRELRDVGAGKIRHVYAGTCPEVWPEGDSSPTDRADPLDECPACEILRRADGLLDDSAIAHDLGPLDLVHRDTATKKYDFRFRSRRPAVALPETAAPAWTPPPGVAVEVLHGSIDGPLLVALIRVDPCAKVPQEIHAEHEERVVWISGDLWVGEEETDMLAGCFTSLGVDRPAVIVRSGTPHTITNASIDSSAAYLSMLLRQVEPLDERAAVLEELERAIGETHRDPVLQALHVGSGAAAIGATQEELDAITRAR